MKKKIIKYLALVVFLAALASLPWILNACGSSDSGGTTTHTMTLKGATS